MQCLHVTNLNSLSIGVTRVTLLSRFNRHASHIVCSTAFVLILDKNLAAGLN